MEQTIQLVCPGAGLYVPGKHDEQFDAPPAVLYVPAVHIEHMD